MQASVQRVAIQSTCLSVFLVQSPALADDSGRKESQHERLSLLGLLGVQNSVLPVVSGFPQQDGHTLHWWTLPASL